MSFENPYMILTMPAHKDCIDLECEVNGYIHIGWRPQGGPFYIQHRDGQQLAQAMMYVGTPEEIETKVHGMVYNEEVGEL